MLSNNSNRPLGKISSKGILYYSLCTFWYKKKNEFFALHSVRIAPLLVYFLADVCVIPGNGKDSCTYVYGQHFHLDTNIGKWKSEHFHF